MPQPARPSAVPEDAVWDEKDKEWQLGTISEKGKFRKKKLPTGQWRYWSQDGYLICVGNFDEEGLVTGTLERFHPDGSLASRGEWKHGNRHGHFVYIRSHAETPEPYPAGSRTWRYEFDSTANWEENNERWFLEDGTECTADGRPLDSAFDLDELISRAGPEDFLMDRAQEFCAAFDEEKSLLDDPFNLQELWGLQVPEVDRFISFAVEGEYFSPCSERRQFEGNIWRSLIDYPWDNSLEEQAAVLLGSVKIGYFGDSDGVYATLFQPMRQDSTPNAVFRWNHETYYVDEVLNTTLDSFAYRMAVATAHASQRLSNRVAGAAWRKLAGCTYVSWALESGLEHASDDGDDEEDDETERGAFNENLDPKNRIRGFFWRGQWILHLLRPDNERSWDDVRQCFRLDWNQTIDDEAHQQRLAWGDHIAPHAIYHLWRYFWFNQTERLTECCHRYRSHASKIVRDLVLLIEDIGQGAVEFRDIKNIMDVREQFLALDLCPENSAVREEKAVQSAIIEDARVEELTKQAEAQAKVDVNAFVQFVWENVANIAFMAKVEPIARNFAGFEMHWRVLDWVRDKRNERDNSYNYDEVADLGEWLGQHQCPTLHPFLWSDLRGNSPHAGMLLLSALAAVPNGLDRRIIGLLVEQLAVVEPYNHNRAFAVKLLRLLEYSDSTPNLLLLIDEFFVAMGDKTDFDARMELISWKDLLQEIALALASFADCSSVESASVRKALRRLAEFNARNYEFGVVASCAKALLAWGETNLHSLVWTLLNDNDDPSRIAALEILELQAQHLSLAERKEFVEGGFRNPDENSNSVTLMFHRAHNALTAGDKKLSKLSTPMNEAIGIARELSNYGKDRWHEWRLVECSTVGRYVELDISEIEHYLYSESSEVRKAAVRAYEMRGVEPPTTVSICWSDVWELEGAASEEIVAEKIAELLDDRRIVNRKPLYAWLWAHPTHTASAALASLLRAEIVQFEEPGDGDDITEEVQWLIRAAARSAKFEPTAAATLECVRSKNDHLLGPLMSEIESLPANFAGDLIEYGESATGWRRAAVASWLLSRLEVPEVAKAIQNAKVDKRKLKSWT